MRYWVGFDVGKGFHWVCVIDGEGEEVLSRKVEATEEDLEATLSEIARLGGERTFGIDLLGGPATLLEAVLLGRGETIFHVPGITVNRPATPTRARPRATPKTLASSPTSSDSGGAPSTRSAPRTNPSPKYGCSSPTAGTCSRTRPGERPACARSCLASFPASRPPWTSRGKARWWR